MADDQSYQLSLFDYNSLDSETRIVVQQRTEEIKTLMRRTAQDIIDIGNKLTEVKARLGHGRFGGWLETEFNWSNPTAQRFMNVAEKFVNLTNLDIAPSALYLLSAPSTPESVREEAIERAQTGETITHAIAKEIVEEHKSPTPSIRYVPTGEPDEYEEPSIDYSDVDTNTGEIVEGESPSSVGYTPPQIPSFGRQKPKLNRAADEYVPMGFDACQTPAYAIDPLCPYLNPDWTIWEPASGEGLLVEALYDCGLRQSSVISSDILTGQNFFEFEPAGQWDALVTNPPYSLKYRWLERCYALGKPFALLLPVETLGAKTAQVLFREHGIEVIFMDQRINFKMPNIGFDGSSAQFPTAWFTWGMNLGNQMIFAEVKRV